jgi:hypothetical protein
MPGRRAIRCRRPARALRGGGPAVEFTPLYRQYAIQQLAVVATRD